MNNNPQEQYVDAYCIIGQLGDGGQANVYLGMKENKLYAVKVYKPGKSQLEAFRQEVQFLSKLKFQSLINMVEFKTTAKVVLDGKAEENRPIVVLEYAEGGDLHEMISKGSNLRAEICRSLFKQLIESIEYLHSKGIAHRDIKPENILFTSNYELKLSDFGLATQSDGSDGEKILTSKLGTEGFKSPEIEEGKYNGKHADLFAAGISLFIMYSGSLPFINTKTTSKQYKLIRDQNYSKFWAALEKKKPEGFFPPSFKKLMNSFFHVDPSKRPTFQSLKEDEWMNQQSWDQEKIKQHLACLHQKVVDEDQEKQKIQRVKCKLMKKNLSLKQNNGLPQKSQKSTISNSFISIYQKYSSITINQLEKEPLDTLIPIKQKPSFTIAWLKQYLHLSEERNINFLDKLSSEIEIKSYKLSFSEEDKVLYMQFIYEIDETTQNLSLEGKLIQIGKLTYGVEWINGKGNDYWLQNIIRHLNNHLKALS